MVKSVFFDKDGVLSPMVGNHGAWNMKEVIFFDGAKQAIRQIQDLGYKTFMVTNQPDPELTDEFHDDMMRLYMMYFGFNDVISARVRGSNNYKPNTGMVNHLCSLHDVDLSKSYFVGDRWRDIVCGHNSGMKTIWVKDNIFDEYECPEEYKHIKPDYEAENVYRACSLIWSLDK
jgi:D-glycero-D-manno-heptose 1,7-bisphosphate phosphatase